MNRLKRFNERISVAPASVPFPDLRVEGRDVVLREVRVPSLPQRIEYQEDSELIEDLMAVMGDGSEIKRSPSQIGDCSRGFDKLGRLCAELIEKGRLALV